MSVARYSREVDLEDLNNAHTLAILSVPAGSRVLDLGAAEGSVARVLAERGCCVTAVERDVEGVERLRQHGVTTRQADLEALEADAFGPEFDVVLLLDVLEHLVAPERVLSLVRGWLAPSGRVVISVPNVAHAAVRLALLQGTFPRSDVGLLDRTHLQFFDRAQLTELIHRAGLRISTQLTVERDVAETEVPVDVDAVAPEVLSAVMAHADARTYQYVVVAQPAEAVVLEPLLSEVLQRSVRRLERSYRALESHATRVHAEMLLVQEHRDALDRTYRELEVHCHDLEARQQALSGQVDALEAQRTSEQALATELADTLADRDVLREQLRERMREVTALHADQVVLRRELAVQQEFAASLAAQVPRIAALGGEAHVLGELERYRAVAVTPAGAAAHAADSAELRRLQQALALRALARVDAWLRRHPRLRGALRTVTRALAGP
jgi:2-polyprenyl-3-methyl-5-hydroxy-6-metoxy-1,4-benzoquinol methylase